MVMGEITVDETEICHSPLFGNLYDLEIVRCYLKLETSVFSLTASADYLKLESLKIIGCEMIEEIFLKKKRDQDERSGVEIELPNLKSLILEDLPRLTGFCKDDSSLALPQLLELRIRNLPKVQALDIIDENRGSTSHSFFNQKIVLATQLKVLSISKMKMNEILKHMLPRSCFASLRVISFCNCDDLSSVVLSDLLKIPKDLKTLHVEGCHLVRVVFDVQKMLTDGHVVLSNLTNLELENLPKMTHIWKHGPETFVGFSNLTKLSVANCNQLTYILSPLIANLLSNLQELSITECHRTTVIIEEGNQHYDSIPETSRAELTFPRLKSLDLVDLPRLMCFCPDLLYDFFCPLLESVWIDCCKEMMVFTAGTLNTPKLTDIWINGRNHTIEGDINTYLRGLQQQSNDGDTSDSNLTSSAIE